VVSNAGGQITSITTPARRSVSYGYNSGYLSSLTSVLGGSWSYSYAGGLLSSIGAPSGTQLAVTWAGGKVASAIATDAAHRFADTYSYGASTTTRYASVNTGSGNVQEPYIDSFVNGIAVSSQTPAGNIWTYQYDRQINQIGKLSPANDQWLFTYSSQGDPTSLTLTPSSGTASVWSYTWDANHQMKSEIDPTGLKSTWMYAGYQLISSAGPSNLNSTSYTYNSLGERLTVLTGATKTTYSYDPVGDVTGSLVSVGIRSVNGLGPVSAYDEAGNLTSTTSADGHTTPSARNSSYTTTNTYDGAGNLLTSTAAGKTTSYGYNPAGRLTSKTQGSNTTTYVWSDLAGTLVTTAGTSVTTTSYDPSGNVRSVASNRVGSSTTNTLTGDGLIATQTNDAGVVTSNTYDADNRLVARSDTAGNTASWMWNALNQQTKAVINGVTTTTSYDLAGRKMGTTGPKGTVTTTYGTNGLVATTTNAQGTTTYTYDQQGNVVKEVTGGGLTSTFAYDGNGHITSETLDGITTSFVYDANGWLSSKTDALARTTSYSYDALGRLTYQSSSGSPGSGWQAPVAQAFGYDAAGRLTNVTDETGSRAYVYDAAGQLTSASTTSPRAAFNGSFTYANSSGGSVSETYPDATVATTTYDASGNPVSVATGTSASSVSVAYQRAVTGREAAVMSRNGTLSLVKDSAAGQMGSATLQCGSTSELIYGASYGTGGQLSGQSIFTQSGASASATSTTQTLPSAFGLAQSAGLGSHSESASLSTSPSCVSGTPSPAGSPSTNDNHDPVPAGVAAPTWNYVPSPLGLPATTDGVVNTAATYTAAGDMASLGGVATVASASHPSELTSVAGESVTYDAAGEVQSITASSVTRFFTYDAAGNLICISLQSLCTGSPIAMTYDYLGRVVTLVNNGAVTYFVYDPRSGALAEEFHGSSEYRRYIYGQGLAAIQVVGGANYYVTNNAQGLPMAETDAQGNLVGAEIQGGQLSGSVVLNSQSDAIPANWNHGLITIPSYGVALTAQGAADITTGRLLGPESVAPNAPNGLQSPYVSDDAAMGAIDPLAAPGTDSAVTTSASFGSSLPTLTDPTPLPATPELAAAPTVGAWPVTPKPTTPAPWLASTSPAPATPLGQTAVMSLLERSALSVITIGQILSDVYKLGYNDTAQQLVALGYNIDAVSSVLYQIYHFTSTALGQFLTHAAPYSSSGFSCTPTQVAQAILSTYPQAV